MIYGPEGVGKSSFAAHFPKVGFITDPKETGIQMLTKRNQCPTPEFIETVSNHLEAVERIRDVARGDLECQTLAVDSLTGFEQLCFAHHCEEKYKGDWSAEGFYAYQAGPKNAARTDWQDFLAAIQSCADKGISVILLAHSIVKTFKNPEGPDYDRFEPYLEKEIYQQTSRFMSATLFYNFYTEVQKEDNTKRTRAKGTKHESERYIYVTRSALYTAKNAFGLKDDIDAGSSGKTAYEAFRKALNS